MPEHLNRQFLPQPNIIKPVIITRNISFRQAINWHMDMIRKNDSKHFQVTEINFIILNLILMANCGAVGGHLKHSLRTRMGRNAHENFKIY